MDTPVDSPINTDAPKLEDCQGISCIHVTIDTVYSFTSFYELLVKHCISQNILQCTEATKNEVF
jgi:hypothetical protein